MATPVTLVMPELPLLIKMAFHVGSVGTVVVIAASFCAGTTATWTSCMGLPFVITGTGAPGTKRRCPLPS